MLGTSESDVAEVAFVRETLAVIKAKRDVLLRQYFAVDLRQDKRCLGWRGEVAFIHTEHDGELQVGMTRTVNRPDQDLIQRGRNDTNGKSREASVRNGKPVTHAERQIVAESEFEIVAPFVELFPNGLVDGSELRVLRIGLLAPSLQRRGSFQINPQLAYRIGQHVTGDTAGLRQSINELNERRHEPLTERFHALGQGGFFLDDNGFAPAGMIPAPGERLVLQGIDLLILDGDQTAFERGKPVVMPPAERSETQGAAREFRERVMRHRFATVHEIRDAVAMENALNDILMPLHAAQQHRHLAIPSARSDVLMDEPRSM